MQELEPGMSLSKCGVVPLNGRLRRIALLALLALMGWTPGSWAQKKTESPYYGRVNTFGILAAYSNDSSHMLLGEAERRKLLSFGVSYNRRIFLNRIVNWQYSGELLPVALESDPLARVVDYQTAPTTATTILSSSPLVVCAPFTEHYNYVDSSGVTYSGTISFSCHGRQWTIGQAMSPVGFQWNFLTRHKIQPFFVGHGGYMYTTRPIPIPGAGSFNFTFDLGLGVELYRSKRQSLRAEYRYHHISNHYTALENPGIDSGLFQLTYCFGR